jgi:molybdopterin molybdotransferase
MDDFFKVTDLENVLPLSERFTPVSVETVPLCQATGRILAFDVIPDSDLPDFYRATMDGYAVRASGTFGASEANPAQLTVVGTVAMGDKPAFPVGRGEAARISTGGMLPPGADAVVMVEHTEILDEVTIEVNRSAAPGQHVIEPGEDIASGEAILPRGKRIRPQEAGLLAALGIDPVTVYRKPAVGIISTGDEVVPVSEVPGPGRIRDVNSYTLSGMVEEAGGIPRRYGIVGDDEKALFAACAGALSETDMVLISGGSSVGVRDYTIRVLSALPDAEILVHGISISPGKPTILAVGAGKPFWGIPGHVVSAMVVFHVVVRPFLDRIGGLAPVENASRKIPARLARNLSSAQGRTDFIRVRLIEKEGALWADPILGKSGLIHTMVQADGLIAIGRNIEGLERGAEVEVNPV